MINTFGLEKKFVRKYAKIPAPFGWKSGPNSVGEIVCARTYSRFLEERGANEQWHEICERVVNGCYKMQEFHVRELNIQWDEDYAQRSAQEMFDRMFHMKFLPPGRGLWCMGTDVTEKRRIHAALFNCAFISTSNLDADKHIPFCFLMDLSMLGVGVGFDTKGAGKLKIKGVTGLPRTFRIPDTREGWVDSLKMLILSYVNGLNPIEFIYSDIRPKGLIIKTFGGMSSGPECLIEMHKTLRVIFNQCKGKYLTSRHVVDIMNLIGVCVVAGNVRRTAEIAFGEPDDEVFANLKNYDVNPDRQAYGWTSNNSINAVIGQSYDKYTEAICKNGEPGFAWLENMQQYSRMSEPINNKDRRVLGSNPCVSGDTQVLTREGYFPAQELAGKKVKVWNGKRWSEVDFKETGQNQPASLVTLSDGTEIKCTVYHKWHLVDGEVETWELNVGDKIEKFELPTITGGPTLPYDAYNAGFFCGDGQESDGHKGILLYGVKKTQNRILGKFSDHDDEYGRRWVSIEKTIPAKNNVPINATYGNRLDWLAGLIDSDGHNPNSSGLVIGSIDNAFLQKVKLLLSTLGCHSKICKGAPAGNRYMPNGKGGHAWYICRESFRLVIGATAVKHLLTLGLHLERVMLKEAKPDRDASRFVTVVSVAGIANLEKVYCASEPFEHKITFNGILTGNCTEQSLESSEMCCVSGNTRIQTRVGNSEIKSIVGKEVEIWNGKRWSKVIPFLAKENTDLFEVSFSDGSFLTVTDNHEWAVKRGANFKKVTTKQLKIKDKLPEFELGSVEGKHEPFAYEYGLFCGDGYMDDNRPMLALHGQKAFNVNARGVYYKTQNLKNANMPVTRISFAGLLDVEVCKTFRKEDKLPDCVWSWDSNSILEFLAGYVDTDGNASCAGFRVFGKQGKLLDLQLLLRRAAINHVSVYLLKGQKNELIINGKDVHRNYQIFTLQVASFECKNVPTRVRRLKKITESRYVSNNAYAYSLPIDKAKKQKVVAITYKGKGNSYCFTEPETHMGVFGNVITYQCLVESFIDNHDSLADYERTLKFAYLYAKTVTLGKTHWLESNRVMLRNRRIGCSISGIQQFIKRKGMSTFRDWCRKGYAHIQKLDERYSEWLCIPRSVKTTSIKPSGTVSLLTGSTPGMHWPVCNHHIRRVTLAKNSSMATALVEAGYYVEDAAYDAASVIVEIPVEPKVVVRDVSQVSMWEQLEMAAMLQAEWADNQVSSTITFDPETEGKDIARALDIYQYRLKGISFLPQTKVPLNTEENVKLVRASEKYKQMPYSPLTEAEYLQKIAGIKRVNYSKFSTREGGSDRFCDGDKCTIIK